MSTTHITPTPGRIVWYRGADGEIRPAIVIKGNGPFNADLYVFPLNTTDTDWGTKATVTHADPEQEPGCLTSWHWMPYQIGQAKKAEDREHDAKQMAIASDRAADDRRMRAGVLDMALRTPGLQSHDGVLKAARAYQAHIEGEKTAPASLQPDLRAEVAKAMEEGRQAAIENFGQNTARADWAGTGLDFGTALLALKDGKRVARAGWNGKGMFAYLVPANAYPAQTGAARAFFGDGALVPYNAYLALKGADDTVSTWAPSGSDALAEDWLIVE